VLVVYRKVLDSSDGQSGAASKLGSPQCKFGCFRFGETSRTAAALRYNGLSEDNYTHVELLLAIKLTVLSMYYMRNITITAGALDNTEQCP